MALKRTCMRQRTYVKAKRVLKREFVCTELSFLEGRGKNLLRFNVPCNFILSAQYINRGTGKK